LADWKGPNNDCQSNPKWASGQRPDNIDWCSATNQAGGCKDAWRLEADFSLASFKITGDCS